VSAWTPDKTDWCCRNQHLGCLEKIRQRVPVLVEAEYDCAKGVLNWQDGWTLKKKRWCCANKRLGCLVTTTQSPYDCLQGYARFRSTWSEEKMDWCCVHEHRACEKYDCDAGFAKWQKGWSLSKKHWCCHHHGRGCQSEAGVRLEIRPRHHEVSFDCRDNVRNPIKQWSLLQKEWCCNHEGVACTPKPINKVIVEGHFQNRRTYNCRKDLAFFQTKWSTQKRTWCCENQAFGCNIRVHTGRREWYSAQFDVRLPMNLGRWSFSALSATVMGAGVAMLVLAVMVFAFGRHITRCRISQARRLSSQLFLDIQSYSEIEGAKAHNEMQ